MALVLNVCIRAKTRLSTEVASDLGAGGLRAGPELDEETLLYQGRFDYLWAEPAQTHFQSLC